MRDSTAPVRGAVRAMVTVQNVGEFAATFKGLFVYSRGPRGENLDSVLGGMEPGLARLMPGERRTLVREAAAFGDDAGTYAVGVSYLSNQDDWIIIPPLHPGVRSQTTFTLYPPKRLVVDETRNVPESTRADLPTGIVLQPGDDYALHGHGTIWAGVWFTGLNGPDGWEGWVETKPNSPMHGTPDAQPFALIGRFGAGPYFKIGTKVERRAYTDAAAAELFLRINDDTPGNGSGQLQCHVEVWR